MEQTVYQENGAIEEKIIHEYHNQKPTKMSFYDQSNTLTFYTLFEYTTNGLLTKVKNYSNIGNPLGETTVSYDNLSRISSVIKIYTASPGNPEITRFTYNTNNTITSSYDPEGNGSTKTFELNSNGIIDKEFVNGNLVTSVTYNNLKPLTKTSYSSTYTYSYNTSGRHPNTIASVFGSYLPNVVLFNNSLSDAADQLTNELISEISNPNETRHSSYTLNSEGFPLTKTTHRNNILSYTYTYTYQ
ncbi:hypothetical protein ABGT15_06620 [Flavobacterium enshiense]|uniref:hypothetical protein n=1 Tax=Flavobacterium enshiense TaxID=1341165 RepID=UPI00345DA3A4